MFYIYKQKIIRGIVEEENPFTITNKKIKYLGRKLTGMSKKL